MGPNGPSRRHRQVNQSYSGEATSIGFPGMTGAVCEIPEHFITKGTRHRQALVGNGTSQVQPRCGRPSLDGLSPEDRHRVAVGLVQQVADVR